MRRLHRALLAALLTGFLIGCEKKREAVRDPNDNPNPAPPPGVPDPKLPPPKVPPPEDGTDAKLVEKEAAALKPLGVVAVPGAGGIEATIEAPSLAAGRIKPEVLAALKNTTALVGLSFQSAHDLTDAGVADLKELAKLRKLHLDGTKITDAGLAHLEALPALVRLEVNDTAVTKDAAAKLQAKLPKCHISGRSFDLPAK